MITFSEVSVRSVGTSNIVSAPYPPLPGIRAKSGTSGFPTLSFSNAPDTGLFNPSVGTLGVAAGGAELVRVSNTVSVLGDLVVSSNIVPVANATQYIGTSTMHLKEAWIDTLHISSNTLYIGDTPVLGTDDQTVAIRADPGQGITLTTTGVGETSLLSEKGVNMMSGGGVTVQVTGLNKSVDIQSSGAGGTVEMEATKEIVMTAPMTTVSSNMTISGDLIVNGSNFTVNTQTVTVEDNIILLNSGQVGSGVSKGESGFSIDRGDSIKYQLLFRESDDKFVMGPQGYLVPIATENFATEASNITSGVLGTARGGTGVTLSTGSGCNVLSDNATMSNLNIVGGIYQNGVPFKVGGGFDDGTVGFPSITFNSDSNTGLYRLGADTIGISTGGLSRVTILDNGNVGFGTNAPESRLHVLGDGYFNGNVIATSNIIGFSTMESDSNIKHHFEPITDALDKIDAIGAYTFEYRGDNSRKRFAGVIAQQVQQVLPEVVDVHPINDNLTFELAGKNQESKFVFAYDKGNTRLAGKTLDDWNNCYTAYILRPVQRNIDAATGSVTPTATWEFVIKDGRVMAKYSKKTCVEPQPERHLRSKRRRTEPTQQTAELVLDPEDPKEREALNKQLRDEKLMTDRVKSEVTKMLYRFCKLNPEFIGTRSDFEAGLKSFSSYHAPPAPLVSCADIARLSVHGLEPESEGSQLAFDIGESSMFDHGRVLHGSNVANATSNLIYMSTHSNAIFGSNVANATSNLMYMSTHSNAVFGSNVAWSTSNMVYRSTHSNAVFGSNTAWASSNLVYINVQPDAIFASNASRATSNLVYLNTHSNAVFESNTACAASNLVYINVQPDAIFASNASRVTSNLIYISTHSNAVFGSNVAWSTSNMVYRSTHSNAVFGSNTAWATSNQVNLKTHPDSVFGSNTAWATSNQVNLKTHPDAVFGSNTAWATSNQVNLKTHPDAVFGSNAGGSAYNIAINCSNLLFPVIAPTALLASNVSFTCSNTLFGVTVPQASFASNHSHWASNTSLASSNFLFANLTPSCFFSSNLAHKTSVVAAYTSNVVNETLYPMASFASNNSIGRTYLINPTIRAFEDACVLFATPAECSVTLSNLMDGGNLSLRVSDVKGASLSSSSPKGLMSVLSEHGGVVSLGARSSNNNALALSSITANRLEWPPVALPPASASTLSNLAYGNGSYTVSASSSSSSSSHLACVFDKLNLLGLYSETRWVSSLSFEAVNGLSSSDVGFVTTTGALAFTGKWVDIVLPDLITLGAYSISTIISTHSGQPRCFVVLGRSSDGESWQVVDTTYATTPYPVTGAVITVTSVPPSLPSSRFRIVLTRVRVSSSETETRVSARVGQLVRDSAAKPSSSTWTVTSDRRIKENICNADLERCYEIVREVPLRRFSWRKDVYTLDQVGNDRSKLGWIAQEVQAVFPKAVSTQSMFGMDDCLALNNDQLIAALYGCVKCMQARIDSLERKMERERERMRSNKFLAVVRVYRENQLALRDSFSRVVPSPLEMAQSEMRSALMDASIAEYRVAREHLSAGTTVPTNSTNNKYKKSIESTLASLMTEMEKNMKVAGVYSSADGDTLNDDHDLSDAIRGGDVQLVRSLVMDRRDGHTKH
eukprot:gene872-biopygen4468